MSSDSKPTKTLDCIGLYCPEPVFQTRMALDELKIGEVLGVVADDPAAEEDIKRLVKRTGNKLLKVDKRDKVFNFLIRKVK